MSQYAPLEGFQGAVRPVAFFVSLGDEMARLRGYQIRSELARSWLGLGPWELSIRYKTVRISVSFLPQAVLFASLSRLLPSAPTLRTFFLVNQTSCGFSPSFRSWLPSSPPSQVLPSLTRTNVSRAMALLD